MLLAITIPYIKASTFIPKTLKHLRVPTCNMSSPYHTPSPPCFAHTVPSTMAPLTPAQSAAVDKKIRAALEKLSLNHTSPGSVAAGSMEPVTMHHEWYTTGAGIAVAEPPTQPSKSTNWSTIDVGFFVPEQTLDQHTVLENGIIYYQDVWAFINYLRVLAESTDEGTIRTNLHHCLREKAFEWYITELTRAERHALRTQSLEEGWFAKLAARFSPSAEVAEDQLGRMGYGWGDVRAEYPVTTWANTMLRHMQALDYGVNLQWQVGSDHLVQIYDSLSLDFAHDVPAPDHSTSVAAFMADLDEAYKRWRWVVLTGPKNYQPREPRVEKLNGTANGFEDAW